MKDLVRNNAGFVLFCFTIVDTVKIGKQKKTPKTKKQNKTKKQEEQRFI
jgi:hypothetical protein